MTSFAGHLTGWVIKSIAKSSKIELTQKERVLSFMDAFGEENSTARMDPATLRVNII